MTYMRGNICLTTSESIIFRSTKDTSHPQQPEQGEKTMIILSVLRGVAAFFAALPASVAEAQKLRREFHRRHPFMEF
jgi:hypothetical protein